MAVFPKAKWFSLWIFPVKNEIQNSISEFASRYGMPAGDHCGDLADMMLATGTGTGSPAPSGHRPRPPVAARVAGPAARPRVAATASHGTGHPDRPPATHGTAARTGTGTASRPRWRRGEAPARLRPVLNKKPATREGSRQRKTAGN